MTGLFTQNCRVDDLTSFYNYRTRVGLLRLDEIHPVISGNKWFKLSQYLFNAKKENKKILLTYGGAYSNHIVATAAAAHYHGFKSIGVIRGEEPKNFSQTLQDATGFNMKLIFVSREFYKKKLVPPEVLSAYNIDDVLLIPEGGYGETGAIGAEAILSLADTTSFTHIVAAVGTGTTLAGLIRGAQPHQTIIGISALKNNVALAAEIESLLPPEKKYGYTLLHQYHFGGYAKYTEPLIRFMNELYRSTNIPTDFVYTAKMCYAVFDLLGQHYFSQYDKILLLHTGGLQGNRSLVKGTLIFGQ